MKYAPAFLLALSFLLMHCGDPSGETAMDSAQTVDKPRLSADSLRKLYAKYRAMQADTLPLQQQLEKGKLYPVDEAPRDTAFFVFRQQLIDALTHRRVFGLLDATAEDVRIEPEQPGQLAAFVEHFHLDTQAPDTLAVWPLLRRVLQEGGTFSDNGRRFTAPYYAATWPAELYDPKEYAVITGTGVRLRQSPSLNGQILKTLSFHPIVRVHNYGPEEEIGGQRHPWVQIELDNGAKGYVFGQFLGSPAGPRLVFEQRDGQWLMVEAVGF